MIKTICCTALVLAALTACSSDANHPTDAALVPSGTSTGLPNDSASHTGTPSAVAGIRMYAHSVTLQVGQGTAFAVYPVDASGAQTFALLAGPVTWSIGDKSIVSMSDTGPSIKALAVGTTKIYATMGAYKDSATITVVAKSTSTPTDTVVTHPPTDSTSNPPTNATSFVLWTYSFARTTPTAHDTGSVVQLGGTSVSLYRLSANPSNPTDSLGVRTLVQTVTSNANGIATFASLPTTGIFAVTATGTYNGQTVQASSMFGAPHTSTFGVALYFTH